MMRSQYLGPTPLDQRESKLLTPEEDNPDGTEGDMDIHDEEMDMEAEDLQEGESEAPSGAGDAISQEMEDALLQEADGNLDQLTRPATPHLSQALVGLQVSRPGEDYSLP